VEKEADPRSIVCAFHSVDNDSVMAHIPHLSSFIKKCVKQEDYDKVFVYDDHSITAMTTSIPISVGKLKVNSRPVPLEVHEHTNAVLKKIIIPNQKRHAHSSASSASLSSISTAASTSSNLYSTASATPIGSAAKQRFLTIERRLDSSDARMASIEQLCTHLKGSTNMISHQLSQLSVDMRSSRPQSHDAPVSKLAKPS
jgi:hypothetical protein